MNRWLPIFAALLLLAGGFWLNTRENRFPYYYHPDELKKVEQILQDTRNFNHPLLLLSTSELAWKAMGSPRERQQVVEIGRTVTAGFCALGTVLFFAAAWLWRGAAAGFATGILLVWQHQVFELAHYMKEDPALYFGVGATCLAAVWLEKRAGWRAALALGAAVGLAFAGKYIGVFLLLPAALLCWRKNRLDLLPLVLGGTLLVFALIDWRLFSELATFQQSFGKEMDWAISGQKELTRSVPHAIYLNILVSNTTPVVWILLVVAFFACWTQRKLREPATWFLLGALVGWLLLLSFSPKTNDRYFLPLTGLIYLLAGGGAAWAWEHWRKPLVAALLIVGAGWEGWATISTWRAFGQDDRAEMTRWIMTNVPVVETIAYDSRVNLPDDEVYHDLPATLPHRLLRSTFAAEIGSAEELREKGVRYVAISESSYGRFFLDSLRPKAGQDEEYTRNAAFYRELKRRQPLWSRPRGLVLYLHPGLEIYDLRK